MAPKKKRKRTICRRHITREDRGDLSPPTRRNEMNKLLVITVEQNPRNTNAEAAPTKIAPQAPLTGSPARSRATTQKKENRHCQSNSFHQCKRTEQRSRLDAINSQIESKMKRLEEMAATTRSERFQEEIEKVEKALIEMESQIAALRSNRKLLSTNTRT